MKSLAVARTALLLFLMALGVGCGVAPSATEEVGILRPHLVTSTNATYDWATGCIVGGTEMHCCPDGQAMVGLHADQNAFKCAPIVLGAGPAILDTGTQRNGMHSCPLGYVMVGLHADRNELACRPIGVKLAESVDYGTQDGFPMHVCGNGSTMSGVRIDRNQFNCAVDQPGVLQPPTNLVVTGSDSAFIRFNFQDHNNSSLGYLPSLEVFEVLADGREISRGGDYGAGPLGGTRTGEESLMQLAGATRACIKIRYLSPYGASMFSNVACGPGGSTGGMPASSVCGVGLGNGVHVTDVGFTNWNYFPGEFDEFRIAWYVCNSCLTWSPAVSVDLTETTSGVLQETTHFPLAGVPPNGCVAQSTEPLTTFNSFYTHWDVFINGVLRGGTGMSTP